MDAIPAMTPTMTGPRPATPLSPCLLRKPGEPDRDADQEEQPGISVEEGEDRNLVCAGCGAGITSRGAAIDVNGARTHTFLNPHGYVFEIGCFSAAPGCIDLGTPTPEHSWFQGFRWCFSACARCDLHLGWRFSSGSGERFWGLILKQLREAD